MCAIAFTMMAADIVAQDSPLELIALSVALRVIHLYLSIQAFIMEPSSSRFHNLGFLNLETKPWEIKANAELLIGQIVNVKTVNTKEQWVPAVITRVVDVMDVENKKWEFYFSCRYDNGIYDRVPVAEANSRMRRHPCMKPYVIKLHVSLLSLMENAGGFHRIQCIFPSDETYVQRYTTAAASPTKRLRLSEQPMSEGEQSSSSSENIQDLSLTTPKAASIAPSVAASAQASAPAAPPSEMPPPPNKLLRKSAD